MSSKMLRAWRPRVCGVLTATVDAATPVAPWMKTATGPWLWTCVKLSERLRADVPSEHSLARVDLGEVGVEDDTAHRRGWLAVAAPEPLRNGIRHRLVLVRELRGNAREGHLATLLRDRKRERTMRIKETMALTFSGRRTIVLTAPLLYMCEQVEFAPVQIARMVWFVPVGSQFMMVHPAASVKSEIALVEPP